MSIMLHATHITLIRLMQLFSHDERAFTVTITKNGNALWTLAFKQSSICLCKSQEITGKSVPVDLQDDTLG